MSDAIVTSIEPPIAAQEWSTFLATTYSFPSKQFKLNETLVAAGPVSVDLTSILTPPMSITHDSVDFVVFDTIEDAITMGAWFVPTSALLATLNWTLNLVSAPVPLSTTILNAGFSAQGISPGQSFKEVFNDWVYTIEWSGVHSGTGAPFTATLS